jgi:hypothetical protein
MAKRLNPMHQEMVRAKIQTTKLLKVLEDDAFGVIVLRDGARDSAKFLINKSMANPPEEKNVKVDGTVTVEIVKFADTASE